MATKNARLEKALDAVNTAARGFISLYGTLVERGLGETEYGKIFDDMAKDFRELYSKANSYYSVLLFNTTQFDEGRLERDAFDRTMIRIGKEVYDTELEILMRIVPRLKKVEKELLQEHIVEKVKNVNMPEEMRKEIRQDAEKIQTWMTDTEKKETHFDQVKEYVGIGERILELGEKVWKFAKRTAPIALPLILRIFNPS